MAINKQLSDYYYASGKRVGLEPALQWLAMDEKQLSASSSDLINQDSGLRSGTSLRGSVRLVRRDALQSETAKRLQELGVTLPVYNQSGTLMVALPEIRIEDEDASVLSKIKDYATHNMHVSLQDMAGCLTLHPKSQNAEDAISLGNEIYEQFHPQSVSPRFLRVTARPIHG